MAQVSHLFRRGGSYSARIRVPLDLVDLLGRKELVKALGTNEVGEAKRRLHPLIAAWHREFDDLRVRRSLTAADHGDAVWDHYVATLDREEAAGKLPSEADIDAAKAEVMDRADRGEIVSANPLAILDATLDLQVIQHAKTFLDDTRQAKLTDLKKHLPLGQTALIAHEVDKYLDANRLLVDRSSPEWTDLAKSMIRAEIEALKRGQERRQGDYTGQPADPLVRPPSGPRRETAKPGESIMEVFEIFASENPRGVAKDRVDQTRRNISMFVDMVGASFPVKKITKTEVREWKQLLVKFPVKATEANVFKGMDIKQIIKANDKIGKPVLSDRTVNRYLSSLGAFLTWAENNGYLPTNPVRGLTLRKEVQSKTHPFTSDQLKTLFASPLFTGCKSGDKWSDFAKLGEVLVRDHRFWLPLIMLFSGARPGEIGQLAVNDLRQEHGHWIMHITEEGDATAAGKSVKTAGSMRVIPVHPELIKLGLIRYHERRVKEDGTQLFPGATRNSRGQMMSEVSREFSRYLGRIGLKEGRGYSLYSFRHGAADALRRAGHLDEQFGFILGHVGASMTGRYGIMPQGMLQTRVDLINSIIYPGLNLDHLVML